MTSPNAALLPAQQRSKLYQLLVAEGFSAGDAEAHLRWLEATHNLTADLDFHDYVANERKASRPVALGEMISHYAGPLHQDRIGIPAELSSPMQTQAPNPPAPTFTARNVVAAAVGLTAFGTLIYVMVRAFSDPDPKLAAGARRGQ